MASANISLKPALVNLKGIRAGDKNEFKVEVVRAGEPIDVTGMSFTAQARVTPLDTESLDAVVDVADAFFGILLLRWPGEDVRTWLGDELTKTGVWDLQMDNGIDDPQTIAAGSFAADQDVTR